MASTSHDNPAFEEDSSTPADEKSSKKIVTMESQELPTDHKNQQFQMTKDICFVSLAFFFLFTSYQSTSNLQSSINANLGTASLSVLYGSMVLSSSFLPTWMINKLGVRNTMAVGMLCYSTYIAAQFHPTYYTLIPTAAVLGLGASPLWSAKCTYLTHVGNQYAVLSGDTSEVVITRFFGIFFLFFQSTQVVGNLISSTVLAGDSVPVSPDDPRLATCGAHFCQGSSSTNTTNAISQGERYTMFGIYLGFALMSSIVVLLTVSQLSRYGGTNRVGSSTGRSTKQQLVATFQHMKHPYQLLVAPLTVWSGLEQAFISADYTAAFVSCGYGVHMIGYTLICFGVCNAVCSFFCSSVVKRVGRIPIFTAATVINLVLICVLMTWRPSPEQYYVFFIIPAFWGIADAVWQTQINAFYGVLFPEDTEAAFSNYKLWESWGFIIAYICSSVICTDVKIYILVGCLIAGIAGYAAIEVAESREKITTDMKKHDS